MAAQDDPTLYFFRPTLDHRIPNVPELHGQGICGWGIVSECHLRRHKRIANTEPMYKELISLLNIVTSIG